MELLIKEASMFCTRYHHRKLQLVKMQKTTDHRVLNSNWYIYNATLYLRFMEYCQRGIGKTGRPKAPEYLMQNNVFYILQEIILTIWLHKQTRKNDHTTCQANTDGGNLNLTTRSRAIGN